ncbi:MAG: hypothetical protein ACYS99_10775 [Planctomycetota bacterium]|jgi:hypothetical protein
MSNDNTMLRGALLLLPILLMGCPSPGGSTPEETFEQVIEHVRAEEYDEVWNLYTDKHRRLVLSSWRGMKERYRSVLENDPGNVEVTDAIVRRQLGIGMREALEMTERDLNDLSVARMRETILGYRIVGKPRIRGKIALLEVSVHEESPQTVTYRMIKRGSKWLIDGDPQQEQMTKPR